MSTVKKTKILTEINITDKGTFKFKNKKVTQSCNKRLVTKCLSIIDGMKNIEDLWKFPGLHAERLRLKRDLLYGNYSCRVDKRYRLMFDLPVNKNKIFLADYH